MQVPSNIIVGKVKYPGVYICAAMAVWGMISACMAAVQSYTGLVLARFFIGFVEAVFFPGALYYMSLFYSRKQYALRVAVLYSGSQLGNAFGGLFAIGILKLDGKHGLQGWRWVSGHSNVLRNGRLILRYQQLFLIEGVATIGLAIIFAFILPNSPKTVRGHTTQEREWLAWTFEQDQGQQDHSDEITAWKGFKMATADPKTWLLMGTLYCVSIVLAS
jgi:MFS family permease